MDLLTLILGMISQGYFTTIARNAAAQFGTQSRRYIGAELLPEREVSENAYREDAIRFRSVIANAGTRYSPVQKKGGDLIASFLVELGSSDIGREINGRDYDALVRYLGRAQDMEAQARILDWADTVLNTALLEFNEKQRWEAIVSAQVTRQGDNGYSETVNYANPANHRSNAGGQWSDDAYDPFDDILAKKDLLESKGYRVTRIISGTPVRTLLARNAKVRQAVLGRTDAAGNVSIERLNEYFQSQELPAPEVYNLQYRTQNGTAHFLSRNSFVMISATGADETLDIGDNQRIVSDVLGYTAIGRATGQADPGRVIRMEYFENKPPRIEGEGWQESLPVITEPEAIGVIGAIS